MPIYEYDCQACGQRFERLVKRADEKVACPECQSGELAKRLSVFSAGASRTSEAPPAPA